ncbi:MAG: hypothetical protein SF172_18015 [Burkholderiales bacterium]|nr:hypothetical protein [Burkholderiales bacterium]
MVLSLFLLVKGVALGRAQGLERGIGHLRTNEASQSAGTLPSLVDKAGDKLFEPDGTLSWKVLGQITIVKHENTDNRFGRGVAYFAEPVVAPSVRALVGKRVKIKGYVLPREDLDGAARFLVSALPAVDEDGCTNGGRETFVDILMSSGSVPKMDTLVIVEGTLTLFDISRWGGYIYRLTDSRIVGAA